MADTVAAPESEPQRNVNARVACRLLALADRLRFDALRAEHEGSPTVAQAYREDADACEHAAVELHREHPAVPALDGEGDRIVQQDWCVTCSVFLPDVSDGIAMHGESCPRYDYAVAKRTLAAQLERIAELTAQVAALSSSGRDAQ